MPKLGICQQSQLQSSLIRHIHNHEIYGATRCLDIRTVVFLGQRIELRANASHYIICIFFLDNLLFCIHIVGISIDGHLWVDDNILVIRVMQDDIGYHLPAAIFIHQDVSFVICQRLLNVIVNSQAQSLAVEQVHQRKFSPITLHLISPLHDIRQTRSRGIYLGSLLGHRP